LTRLPGGDLGVRAQVAAERSRPQQIKVEVIDRTGRQHKVSYQGQKFNLQETVVSLLIDAVDNDRYGAGEFFGRQ